MTDLRIVKPIEAARRNDSADDVVRSIDPARDMRPISRDVMLEIEILTVRQRMVRSSDIRAKRVFAKAMAELIALRSPEAVAAMERNQGLY